MQVNERDRVAPSRPTTSSWMPLLYWCRLTMMRSDARSKIQVFGQGSIRAKYRCTNPAEVDRRIGRPPGGCSSGKPSAPQRRTDERERSARRRGRAIGRFGGFGSAINHTLPHNSTEVWRSGGSSSLTWRRGSRAGADSSAPRPWAPSQPVQDAEHGQHHYDDRQYRGHDNAKGRAGGRAWLGRRSPTLAAQLSRCQAHPLLPKRPEPYMARPSLALGRIASVQRCLTEKRKIYRECVVAFEASNKRLPGRR
jgi:hypothetical protein